jgi:hypothetical protein
MPKTKQSNKTICEALRTFDPLTVPRIPNRDQSIRVRVTTQECDEIKDRAQRLEVSVSDLFRQLFIHAKDRL